MDDKAVEPDARFLIRQQIEDSGWYPKLKGKYLLDEIEQDVERYRHLMIAETRQRLLSQVVEGDPNVTSRY